MNQKNIRQYQESVTVQASTEVLYDLVSDITRTGEWSPVCTSCRWDDPDDAGRIGAWFTGRNELPSRSWETRSQVVAAERGREFAWVVGGWQLCPLGLPSDPGGYGDDPDRDMGISAGRDRHV